MGSSRILTVTQVNTYIKSIIEGDRKLNRIMLRGEISNFKSQFSSGHFYFTLKDSESSIRAVMFKKYASTVRFTPENGMSVVVSGDISVYEKEGQYQVYCTDMMPDGIGSLALAFEQLKQRLSEEGLFNPEHKKAIPQIPKRIAVITSKTGAAIQDILSVLSRRYPVAEVILCPVTVQGADAPASIVNALGAVNRLNDIDVIILARGGGSYEDLFCFNDEVVARAIYDSKVPVISAIGHETDFTIADFVADLRAPTPSAASELAVPELTELQNRLHQLGRQLNVSYAEQFSKASTRMNLIADNFYAMSPLKKLKGHYEQLQNDTVRLNSVMINKFAVKQNQWLYYTDMLDALSPLKVLQRGYALAYKNNRVIKSTGEIHTGDQVTVRIADGEFDAKVL
ncbi:exodeoxyribonuclease VII large subunit [Acetanaerobacterium elongatum]|uniref:Exodeoxyribonuclease 7 large subunit n=1 Tax=Acetanaerobacterium elongatum TaxID=258515 RepID=A0A1H0AQM3_9FIRM|nr:exodeoxyribonuclease VII large subunit [Acetanaerobacterium elongatum]SDN35691.1 Exodeoxyribonuclease VII large subunit [Acetanaerobacterium elongatum]